MRGRQVKMLEIGLGCNMHYGPGASIPVWKEYFGHGLRLDVLEYDRDCAERFKSHVRRMYVGDQADVNLLRSIVDENKDDLYGTTVGEIE